MLDGSFFDDIAYSFETEKLGAEYLPLTRRRPSVQYNLARIVTDQSSGSLWTDDEIATVVTDAGQQKNITAISDEIGYDAVMMEAYERSAAGSGAIIVHGSPGDLPMIEALPGKFARPVWSLTKPNVLDALERIYPLTKKQLQDANVALPEGSDDLEGTATFWLRVVYTPEAQLRFTPLKAEDYARLGEEKPDKIGVFRWTLASDGQGGIWPHPWGVVQAVWLRSLLFGRDDVDGRCAYGDIADIQVEIARDLSQVGRGFRYSADPLIVRDDGDMARALVGIDPLTTGGDAMRGPAGEVVRSASNVLYGKYSLLEPVGSGLLGTIEYVKVLREWALETAGAMKADAATTKGAMSGRALDLLQQMMRLLVKRQRIAYGTRGMIPLTRLLLTGCRNGAIAIPGVENPNPDARMHCDWPKKEPEQDDEPPVPTPTVPPLPDPDEVP